MPATDPFTQLHAAALSAWDNAKLYPQDGGIIAVVPHEDYARLGAALERIGLATPLKTRHRSVIVRGPVAEPGVSTSPVSATAPGSPELGHGKVRIG